MTPDPLSTTFFALADATRRGILARLTAGDVTVSKLAEPYDMSLAAISKHLKVLEGAGLISRGRNAQWRPCRLEAKPLKAVAQWVQQYERFWNRDIEGLRAYMDRIQRRLNAPPRSPELGTRPRAPRRR